MTANAIYTLQVIGFSLVVLAAVITPTEWKQSHELEILIFVVLPLGALAIWSTELAHRKAQAENTLPDSEKSTR